MWAEVRDLAFCHDNLLVTRGLAVVAVQVTVYAEQSPSQKEKVE